MRYHICPCTEMSTRCASGVISICWIGICGSTNCCMHQEHRLTRALHMEYSRFCRNVSRNMSHWIGNQSLFGMKGHHNISKAQSVDIGLTHMKTTWLWSSNFERRSLAKSIIQICWPTTRNGSHSVVLNNDGIVAQNVDRHIICWMRNESDICIVKGWWMRSIKIQIWRSIWSSCIQISSFSEPQRIRCMWSLWRTFWIRGGICIVQVTVPIGAWHHIYGSCYGIPWPGLLKRTIEKNEILLWTMNKYHTFILEIPEGRAINDRNNIHSKSLQSSAHINRGYNTSNNSSQQWNTKAPRSWNRSSPGIMLYQHEPHPPDGPQCVMVWWWSES